MSMVSLNGSNGTKRDGSSKPMFITGERYYIIDKETRDKVLWIVGEEMKLAAKMAQDPNSTKDEREKAHRFAQGMIDLQGALLYAEGGIAHWENDEVALY